MSFGAEGIAFLMDLIWMRAGGTVRGVAGECFHDIELVVMGQARISGGNFGEADLARRARLAGCGGRHNWFALCSNYGRWRRWCWCDVVVSPLCVLGRHLASGRRRGFK